MNGDTIGPRTVDKSVGVNLSIPVVFFQKKELKIFVRKVVVYSALVHMNFPRRIL